MTKKVLFIIGLTLCIFAVGIRVGIDYTVKYQHIECKDDKYQSTILNGRETYTYDIKEGL